MIRSSACLLWPADRLGLPDTHGDHCRQLHHVTGHDPPRDVATACLLFSALAAPAASAQPAAPHPDFSVSITEAVDVVEQVGTTRRIGQPEIQRAQARTLDDALRLVPGIFVRVGPEGTPRVDIRGLRSRQILLLLDGVPVTATDDGQFDPSRIPAAMIREIKVTYSSTSMLYGENAMAGAIEIVTETAAPGLHAAAGADLRESAQRTGDVHFTAGNERVAFVVTGDAFASDGFRVPDAFTPTATENGGLRENSDRTRNTALARLNVGVTEAFKIGTLWSVGRGSNGLPPSSIDDPNDRFAQRARYERVEAYDTLVGQVSAAYLPQARFNVRGWAFVNRQQEDRSRYDDRTYSGIDDPTVSGSFSRHDETRVTGGAVHGKYNTSRAGRLRFAVNGRREQYATTGVIRDAPSPGSSAGGGGGGGGRGGATAGRTFDLRSFDELRHVEVYSVAGEWEVRAPKDIWVAFGIARNWQARAGGIIDPATSWMAGLTRAMTSTLSLRGSVSHRVRFPSIRQLYEDGTGNTALEPERSYAAEVGLDQRWGRDTDASITAFWMLAKDFIERDAASDVFMNHDRYRFAGFEATLRARIAPPLGVWASYSFLDSRDQSPGTRRDELQNRPRHRVILQPRWEILSGFAAQASLQYVADQVFYSRDEPLMKQRADDYVMLDVALVKTLARSYEISIGVDNVFDTLAADAYGFPNEGRCARIRLGARF